MLKQFRSKSLKAIGIIAGVLILVASILLACGAYNIFAKFRGAKDLYALENDQLKNAYAEGEVYLVYDSISEVRSANGNLVSREYLVPIGTKEYMVFSVPAELVPATEKILEDSLPYLKGETTQMPKEFITTGKVVEMNPELLDIYHKYVSYDDKEDAEKANYLPYVWTIGRMGNVSNNFVYIGGLTALILYLTATVLLLKAFFYGYQREVRRYPEKDRVAVLLNKTKPVRNRVYLNADMVIFHEGLYTHLLPTAQISAVEVVSDSFGSAVLLKTAKRAKKIHLPKADAPYVAEQIARNCHIEAPKKETYKSILE